MAMKNVLLVSVCILLLFPDVQGSSQKPEHADVIILGAGMAGIAAAKTLSEKNVANILILEGSNSIGGRVREAKIGGVTVQIGANWVAGTEGNPLWDLAKKYKISGKVSDFDDVIIRNSKGQDVTESEGQQAWHRFEKAQTVVKKMDAMKKAGLVKDMSIRTALELGSWFPLTPVENAVEIFEYDFEFAESPDYTALETEETIFSPFKPEQFYVCDKRGYSTIIREMAKGVLNSGKARIKLNHIVSRIHYDDSRVIITTQHNKTFTADYIIVTFSLGVLQQGHVEFYPPLPFWKRESIYRARMADYIGVFLKFPATMKRFWDTQEFILYAHERRGYFPIWQNLEANGLHPKGTNILEMVTWADEAERIQQMTDREVQEEVMGVLRSTYFNVTIPDPEEILVPRWLFDPLFLGSFPCFPPGFQQDYQPKLQAPLGRLHFAGDSLDDRYYGYVHGAMFSGIRTAKCILKARKQNAKT